MIPGYSRCNNIMDRSSHQTSSSGGRYSVAMKKRLRSPRVGILTLLLFLGVFGSTRQSVFTLYDITFRVFVDGDNSVARTLNNNSNHDDDAIGGSMIVHDSTATSQVQNDLWLPSRSSIESLMGQTNPSTRPPGWQTDTPRSIMYVHVGKTGGTTLDAVFLANCRWYRINEVRQRCLDDFQKRNRTESTLSTLVKSTMHGDRWGKFARHIDETTSFLFTVRNPISRAVSAYEMHHIDNERFGRGKKQFYVDCFPTIEDLSRAVRNDTVAGQPTPSDCVHIAHTMLTGGGTASDEMARMCYHLARNYGFYTQMTTKVYPEKEIIVVRTEHLWQDLRRLDVMLGGDGKSYEENLMNDHGRSSTYKYRSTISSETKQLLCCGLLVEIQIYESLIVKATNLKYNDKVDTMNDLLLDCSGHDDGRSLPSSSSSLRWEASFSWSNWSAKYCPQAVG